MRFVARIAAAALVAAAAVTSFALHSSAAPDGVVKIGSPAPLFALKDLAGKERALAEFKGKVVVLEWFNHGCPFVIKHYGSGNMQKHQKAYTGKGVVWLSICSSSAGKQGNDTPEGHAKTAKDKGTASTAILLDDSGEVGRLYGAKTTPHMFVIDAEGNLRYMGAIDSIASAKAADIEKAENYVAAALDALLKGESPKTTETKSYGCSVKY
jgi:peroxiredoxin